VTHDVLRVLFVSDTHLGFDLPARPRVERRRRGDDFFRCYETALRPAFAGEVDVVVHGGDLLFRSRVPAPLVDRALEPLRRVAQAGVDVLLVPGNHERSAIPRPLFAAHPRLRTFHSPGTFVVERRGIRAAFAGFPHFREGVRQAFAALVAATRYREARAHVNVLCMHHCFEGATCGPGFTFRDGPDVVRAEDLPTDLAAVLSGHIHRHQVLVRDLQGRPLRAPVLYPGSVERTSFVERHERKGYLVLTFAPADDKAGGRLAAAAFRPLPARPMHVHELGAAAGTPAALEAQVRAALARMPEDAVVQIRLPEEFVARGARLPSAWWLRSLAPRMNVTFRAGRDHLDGGERRERSRELTSTPTLARSAGGGGGGS
jgi:DNA repair exonuclease SbcCD nuclease subunit